MEPVHSTGTAFAINDQGKVQIRIDCSTLTSRTGGFTKPGDQTFNISPPASTNLTDFASNDLWYWQNQYDSAGTRFTSIITIDGQFGVAGYEYSCGISYSLDQDTTNDPIDLPFVTLIDSGAPVLQISLASLANEFYSYTERDMAIQATLVNLHQGFDSSKVETLPFKIIFYPDCSNSANKDVLSNPSV